MIDFDAFLSWAQDRFQGDVLVKGNEIKVHSPFIEADTKYHLWCNPMGGKKDRPAGVYRCWKTDKRGSLINLVMEIDNCNYEEAKEILEGSGSLRLMEKRLEEFFNKKNKIIDIPVNSLILPPDTFPITSLPENDFYRLNAEMYLNTRKIPIDDLYFCTGGEYKNRIVIPYYDKFKKLIYWNSRDINEKSILRYRGPDKAVGVGKSDVIFVKNWPKIGNRIYLTEGEFDAISLCVAGFHGAACGGKSLHENQIELLQGYEITIALDCDISGKNALEYHMGDLLLSKGFKNTKFVSPPQGYKDWNKMLEKFDKDILMAYVIKHERYYSDDLKYRNI